MLPADGVAELKAAGLFRLLQPKKYGGYEMNPQVFYDVAMTLAEGCMSTAWVYSVVAMRPAPPNSRQFSESDACAHHPFE